jgi:hypothetical protein
LRIALAVAVAAVLVGCEAHRFPLASEEVGRTASDLASYKHLRLAVLRPPDPSKIDESAPDGWLDKLNAEHASWLAQHLIEDLDSTNAFSAVGYPNELESVPSAVVEPLEGPPRQGPRSVDTVMITFFTLGIVPVYHRFDRGLHFGRVDKPAPDFHCDWPTESVVGWLGLVLRLSPSWEYGWADEPRRAHFRRCLQSYEPASLE